MMEIPVGVPARSIPLDVASPELPKLPDGAFNTVSYYTDPKRASVGAAPRVSTSAQTPASNEKDITSTSDEASPNSFITPSRPARQYGKTDSPFIPDIHPTPSSRRRPPFSRRRRSGSVAFQKMAAAIPSVDDEILDEERYRQQKEAHTEWKLANIRSDAQDGPEEEVVERLVTEAQKRKRSEDPEEGAAGHNRREKAAAKGQEEERAQDKKKSEKKETHKRTKRRRKKAEEAWE